MKDEKIIEAKIDEAKEILRAFELNVSNSPVVPLTLLALCNIKPDDIWNVAERRSMTLVKGILEFVNQNYKSYQTGSRESFRKEALAPLIEMGVVDFNPDNPNLAPQSSNTHYAISLVALNTIRKFNTDEWAVALETYLKIRDQNPIERKCTTLLKSIGLSNYKSIRKDKILLGRFNVFIGANGCGKTNILEAVAVAGAFNCNDLTYEGLYGRGVRMARPNLLISSFAENDNSSIDLALNFLTNEISETYSCALVPTNINDVYTKWANLVESDETSNHILSIFSEITRDFPGLSGEALLDIAKKRLDAKGLNDSDNKFGKTLIDYSIYDLNTKSLRGISPSESKKTPLGLNGEGLDLLISSFTGKERKKVVDAVCSLFDWLSEIISDKDDKYKNSGLKPGRSTSTLFFKDRFMDRKNNLLSAENSNEGILHVLFYLALFISDKTPNLFAIDNIEKALNPILCQRLIKQLAKMAEEHNKQVLITTHNPAVLDGMNLLDDEQRLFEVYRNDAGHTVTKRIKFKSDLTNKTGKLSQMWLNGVLGAQPANF